MKTNEKYRLLLSPIQINGLTLKNRIIAAPAGDPTLKAYGGAAVCYVGSVAVDCDKSFWNTTSPYPFSRYEVERQKDIVNACHYGGSRVGVELFHAGQWCRVAKDDFAWGVSDTVLDDGTIVKALTEEEMQVICDAYAKTAVDAKNVGYDMIFLHFAHGWLISSFLSPHYNHRKDAYGGTLENRAKFPLQVLQAVRNAVGPDFPIDMRINDHDRIDHSIEFSDVIEFVKLAEPYIDAVQLSCGQDMNHEGNIYAMSTNIAPHMLNVDYAAELRKHVKHILVYAVGGILSVDDAERILEEGKVDMVALGRSLIADPQLPNKLIEHREEEITPCLRCNYCYHIATGRANIGCSVNPTALRKTPKEIVQVNNPKKVIVIGGGPAGIMAAVTASKAGHNVILLEKEAETGGLVRYIAREHYKRNYKRYLTYLNTMLLNSTVEVRLNTEATPELIKEMDPDRLIIATGGTLMTPRIPGAELPHVLDCLSAIAHPEKIGKNVVIIGGGVVGIELALGLSLHENRQVTVVEMTDQLYRTANMNYGIALRQEIEKAKDSLHIHINSSCQNITSQSVEVKENGVLSKIPADTVILAIGLKNNRKAAQKYYGITAYTDLIGDAYEPRIILDAVFEGYSAGNKE